MTVHAPKIAFITQKPVSGITPDDALAARELERRGCRVEAFPWDGAADAARALLSGGFDAAVLRSPWNYYLEPERFTGFIDAVEASGVRLFNGPGLIRWNCNKAYLRTLEASGVPVLPTEFLESGSGADLLARAKGRGWREVVLKPALSAGGWETLRLDAGELASPRVDSWMERHARSRGAMLQEFRPEIEREGERSYLFFGGRFSHAVRKIAAQGEFRVQEEHGGGVEGFMPSVAELEAAARVIAALPEHLRRSGTLLYARVDCVEVAGRLQLMEFEVLEPALYFRFDAEAPGRFADVLLSSL